MKRFVVLAVVALVIALGTAVRAADPSGRWSATFMSQVGEQAYTYDFVVKGTTLTGTAKGSLTGETKITDGKVDGYISRLGDSETDRDTVLNHYLAKASLTGDKLTFTSKPVHAVWYEFSGTIGRGPAKNRAEDGYYQIVGTLIEHRQKNGKEESARQRQVVFKLFADESEQAK